MKNNKNVANSRKTLSKRLAVLVATAVVANQVASIAVPVKANDVNSEVIRVENAQAKSSEVYTLNFDETDSNAPEWHNISGDGTRTIENGYLNITRNSSAGNNFVFYDQKAPMLTDGEVETEFSFEGGTSRFGVVVRPATDGNYLFIGYNDSGKWLVESNSGWKDDIAGPTLVEGQAYKLKARFEGKKITIWVDGEQIFSDEVDINNMPTGQGYGVGFRTWYDSKSIKVNYLKFGPVGSIEDNNLNKDIKSVEEVNVETIVKTAPKLPAKVNVVYEDNSTGTENVIWNSVDKESYAKEGTFEVIGTLEGREDVTVTATVTVKAATDGDLLPPDVVLEEKTLVSEDMTVVLDNNFPRVIRYEWKDGEVLTGEEEQLFKVDINDFSYVPSVEFTQVDAKTADYTMTFDQLDVTMKVRLSLAKDNVLRMEVTEIKEECSFKVRTINFANHSLASVKSTENGKISGVLTTGDWNNIKESFEDVANVKAGDYSKTYGIINDDKFAITIDNNVVEGGNRVVVNVSDEDGYKKAGLSNGTWVYRESVNSATTPAFEGTIGGVEIKGNTNQPIFSNDKKVQSYMGKEYEAVYCGLGGVEDFEGLDLTGKVAIVDRGTHTFEDKAKNAQAAGASYIICINNVSGAVPEQGYKDTINMIGLSSEYGDLIKATLDENNRTTVKLSLQESDVVPGNPEELPWSQIMIARDENGNGKVNWQDAAILYRENMEEVQGADYVRNSFSYIPFNIGSLAQSPFLYTADTVKKLSNYTDGFGQLVLEKGYQGEGHDDVIADIGGHTGIRQGGKDDLNTLIEIGKDYNAKIGVHVNTTEYHLDAFELDVDNLKPGFQKGWGWKDDSYYVDQKQDVITGELERRFSMLKEDHPDLAWIYVDVYTGNGWNANELAEIVNNNDWMLATEFNGPLEQQVAWTHWGGDPAYPNRGNESTITRFIRNQEQDVYMSDDLLKGGKHMLSGGWGTRHDIEGFYAVETFYNQTLPSKYMQHFEIQEWEDDGTDGGFVKFNDNLEVIRENGYNNMYKDGKLISSTAQDTIDDRGIGKTTLFIPWTWEQLSDEAENKVYHWNPYGGETTWELPNGWEGTQTVKLYELSDLGRTFVEEIEVVNGQVTIDAKENTPYVVFQEKVSEDRIDNWGEGTLINDPGFDSQTLDNWTVESTSDNMDHISIINETVARRNGNDALFIQGIDKVDPSLIPQSQMTATATTYQSGEDASKAIDGNEGTLWHASYSGVTGPQSITLDLGGSYEVNKVTCLPRQSGTNGIITKYELQVSNDGINFTTVAQGDWDKSASLKTISFDTVEATHIRLVANEYVNGFVSIAELNVYQDVEIPDEDKVFGEGANISQDLTGLEPGKTYTASVWVKNYGDREVTLGVNCGGVDTTSTIDRATTRMNVGEGLKWHGEKLTRMRVEFTVPEGVTTAKLYVDIPRSEEATSVMLDDFRIWTNPLESEATNREGYVLYEDFENVDEGHGPLYMGQALGTDNRTHYAEKDPEGKQYMNWVISDRFSLKTNQQAGTVGEMLLTDQSTLQLEPNTTYELGFKYTNKIDNLYSVAIKSATEGVLFSEVLTPGEVIGTPEDGPNYSREVKEFKIEFTTGDAVDYYLSIDKGNGYDELVLDDLYIKDLTSTDEGEDVVVNKSALQIAVEIANEVTESDLANVVPAVVTEFRAALEEAKAILAKENATEAEINASFDRLSAVMQMLSFEKGDKEVLGSLIERINGLNGDEYISNTWTNLQTALEVANAVMADENAMENEVSETYKSLLRSFLELRLKPSKDKLNDLINKVQTLDSSKYTAKSWKAVEAAVEKANAVMNNEDATEDEIANAEKSLQSAIDGLKETASSGSNSGSSNNNGSTNNSESNNVASGTGSNNSSNTSNSGKLPNTGGVNSLWVALTGVLAAGAGFLTRRKK